MKRTTTPVKKNVFGLRSFSCFVLILMLAFVTKADAQRCALACNDNVQVSLDENCQAEVTYDLILEDPGDDCDYRVVVYDPQNKVIPNATVTGAHIGFTLKVAVYLGNNSCWGTIKVEDKLPPFIDCGRDLIFGCEDHDSIPPFPIVIDNCDPNPRLIELSNVVTDLDCDFQGFSARRIITYMAVDKYGNESAPCQQVIWYARRDLSAVEFPPHWDGIDTVYLTCLNKDPVWDLDGDEYPDPEETGVPTIDNEPIFPSNNGFCEINVTYDDQILHICPKSFKILRTWTVYDWCRPPSQRTIPPNPIEYVQVIKVLDDEAPVVSCPPNLTISTDVWSCEGSAFVDPPFIIEECNTWDYEVFYKIADPFGKPSPQGATPARRFPNGLYYVENLPVGLNWVIYKITDACGNERICVTEIYVDDQVPPVPVCDEFTVVALTADGSAKAYAETFDDGSVDNCEIDFFEVRRMDRGNPCGDTINEFRPYVEFCCEDIGNSVMVQLRVHDKNGNSNTCMVEVDVQDKLPPSIVCPPNITVDCNFDYSDLSVFGTVRLNKDDREEIIIPGKNVEFSGPPIDGYAYDNCGGELTLTETDTFKCGQGIIYRKFKITDPQGRMAMCTQTIRVIDFDRDNIRIRWPDDFEDDVTCTNGNDTDPDVTGRPVVLGDDKCNLIATNYTDQTFILEDDVCLKILRTWVIIDWCVYDPNNGKRGPGYWDYVQIIKLRNSIAPEFTGNTCEYEEFELFGANCLEDLTIIGTAEDDCTDSADLAWTYFVDIFNDGNFDRPGVTNDASGPFPPGRHKIIWQVEDQCGNLSVCEKIFDVVDRKKPTPYCLHGIATVIMPSTKSLEIWASDFNLNSEDNCTEKEDLKFWFLVDSQFVSSMTFDCDNIGQNTVRVYVEDEAGNFDYCETYINVEDPNEVCGTNLNAKISGLLSTREGTPIGNATVLLDKMDTHSQRILQTDAQGRYEFDKVSMYKDYRVRVELDKHHDEGVSTKDIVLIQRHLLGIASLVDAYEVIAADADNSQSISAKDLITIRKLLLGKILSYPDGQRSWRFVPQTHRFAGIQDVFPFPETVEFNKLSSDKTRTHFYGVKIGDVDQSANLTNGSVQNRDNSILSLQATDQEFKAGDQIELKLKASSGVDMYGFQMELLYNTDVVSFSEMSSATLEFGTQNYNETLAKDGIIRMSWSQAEAFQMADGESWITIHFIARSSGKLSDVISMNSKGLRAECYASDGDFGLSLRFSTDQNEEEYVLYPNRPNPFVQETDIRFFAPMSGPVRLSVFDLNGRLIHTQEAIYQRGEQNIRLKSNDLESGGILYYQLETPHSKLTGKMVKM